MGMDIVCELISQGGNWHDILFKLIFTVHTGNETLNQTQFFFPNFFPKRGLGQIQALQCDLEFSVS
jgi:hypothetical protein